MILSDNPRRALAIAASRFFGGQPEVMVAVTGTNGKTSVASFTRQIWEALGETAVNFGTVGVEGAVAAPLSAHDAGADHAAPAARRPRRQGRDPRGDGGLEPRARPVPARRRAAGGGGLHQHHPRPSRLSRRLRGLLRGQARRSSSACCRGRARRSINLDDPHGPRVRRIAKARGQRLLTVGRAEGCALRLIGQRFDATGQELLFAWERQDPQGAARPDRRLPGAQRAGRRRARHRLGQRGRRRCIGALPGLRTVRGRMERAATRANGAAVFVDYAHTPGRADHGADRAAPARHGAAHRRLRRRRRPRPRQAAADGRGGGRGGRRGLRHRRQPAHRGRRPRSAPRCAPARPRRPRSATGPRRS